MGSPFVISLVHFGDKKEDDKGKGKAKAKPKTQPSDAESPSSMVGLIISPLPDAGDKSGTAARTPFASDS
jgi:hypothetical protein